MESVFLKRKKAIPLHNLEPRYWERSMRRLSVSSGVLMIMGRYFCIDSWKCLERPETGTGKDLTEPN